jgi:hypothetical protein
MPRVAASRVRASRRRISASEGRISGGGVSGPGPPGAGAVFPGSRGRPADLGLTDAARLPGHEPVDQAGETRRLRVREPGQLPPGTVALHPAQPPIVSEEPDGARLKSKSRISGRGVRRWSTASWWRRTRISMSLLVSDRARSTSQPSSFEEHLVDQRQRHRRIMPCFRQR